MYELYFGDETTMPSSKSRRFKNFSKGIQPIQETYHSSSVSYENDNESVQEVHLPEDIIEVLEEKDITETPFIVMRSNLSSKKTKGESYAIGFDEFLVIMWRKDEEPFKLVKIEHFDVIDVSGGVEDDDDSIIVLMISTDERTYSLWFNESQTDELVTFINSWKYHQIHQIGGKTDIKFDDDPIEEEEELEVAPPMPEMDDIEQKDLPRTVLFGTLLIDQVADGHNITELDLEYLNMTITNPDLLAMCIQNFKRDVSGEVKELVKKDFNDRQKLMLMVNMADLAYRNGDAHQKEIEDIKSLAEFIDFDSKKMEELLDIFKVKNDPETLESY
ncbi:MAG: hypothetical protein NE327_13125 [Lentisphaeraceae bacterium]|nr:hypothetical protein [Lentisphaeraceae bacterium]